jgi:anthranilate synthase component 2
MLLLIDNYDSFTYNLVHAVGELGAEVVVRRNDALDVQQAMAMRPAGIVLSPGPCDPDRAGICLALTRAAAETGTPLLGVCLGHQTLGQAFGGRVVRHPDMTRYHSLVVARDSCPDALEITAALEDGTIMGLRHRTLPMHGVQFHPESIASEHGHALLRTFLDTMAVPA